MGRLHDVIEKRRTVVPRMTSASENAMNWDLTSYFSCFDGPEVAEFKTSLEDAITELQHRCARIAPLDADTAGSWEVIFLEAEGVWQRLSHLGSYLGCLSAADSANEAYKAAESAFAAVSAEAETLEVDLKRGRRLRRLCAAAAPGRLRALPEPPARRGAAHHESSGGAAGSPLWE